jgi:hypothetical protein
MIDPKEESELARRTVIGSYRTQEDLIDLGTVSGTLSTRYKVGDLLKGQSKRNWKRKFGDS